MGITIVEKSESKRRKKKAKIALVLAGGAVSGGAFKLGGIKALDDFLVNRKTTDFDTYVGLSAGAVLAVPLSAGISPAEMLKSLEGKSSLVDRFQALDFYSPNFRELLSRPLEYMFTAALYFPSAVVDLLRSSPKLAGDIEKAGRRYLKKPTRSNFSRVAGPLAEWYWNRPNFPSVMAHFPSGLFDNASIERYIRRNLEKAGLPNDFKDLYQTRKRELYIAAMNLDTAERAIFGHDRESTLTVSEAVQASTALPGFYRPARLNGDDYVDGGVRRTANLDVAVEHGADLIICYNPFRPFSNRPKKTARGFELNGQRMADAGLLTILNQVFRTMLHSRLQYGLRQLRNDPKFKGDIIVVEPKESDAHFFELNALAYWERMRAAQLGYQSVTDSIRRNYDRMRDILSRHGLTMTKVNVERNLRRMKRDSSTAVDSLTREFPARRLRIAS